VNESHTTTTTATMSNNELLSAVERDYQQTVENLLAGPRTVVVDQGEIFARAVERGNEPVLKYILDSRRFDAAENPKVAFEWAIVNNRPNMFSFLLHEPRFDPTVENGAVFHMAAASGHGPIMDILRIDPRADPAWSISQEYLAGKQRYAARVAAEVRRLDDANSATKAFEEAISTGDVVKVKLLLQSPLVKITGFGSKALVFAIGRRDLETVELLMRDGRFGGTKGFYLPLYSLSETSQGVSIAERLLCDERARRKMEGLASDNYTGFALRAMRLYAPKLASVLSRLGISAEASASVLKQALRLTGLKKKAIGDLVNLE
jgi:hypothetical protein